MLDSKGVLFPHWKVPCYFKYNTTFPKTFCRSVSYKYWHIQAMYPPTEQVEDHSQINFSVLLFQRKWISASSAFQCSPSSKLARCKEESDFCDNQKHGQAAFSWGVLNTLVQKEATPFSRRWQVTASYSPIFPCLCLGIFWWDATVQQFVLKLGIFSPIDCKKSPRNIFWLHSSIWLNGAIHISHGVKPKLSHCSTINAVSFANKGLSFALEV